MNELGLEPHEREGAGHINIGLAYFKARAHLLRNFVIDFYNHPGVGTVLNSLTANQVDAPYLEQISKDHQAFNVESELLDGLPKLDRQENFSFDQVLKKIGSALVCKYVALGFREIGVYFSHANYTYVGTEADIKANDRSRLEVRTFRPQKNMADFIKALEILEARINFLKSKRKLIPLNPSSALNVSTHWRPVFSRFKFRDNLICITQTSGGSDVKSVSTFKETVRKYTQNPLGQAKI